MGWIALPVSETAPEGAAPAGELDVPAASSCSFLHFTLHDVRCSDLTPDGVGVQWSLCLFITCLPFETALRVWDVFFYDGAPALSRVALALFKLAEPAVASSTNAIQALQALQRDPFRCFPRPTALHLLDARPDTRSIQDVAQAVPEPAVLFDLAFGDRKCKVVAADMARLRRRFGP
eukprot:2165695-Rhodomonas_salina.3